MSTHKTNIKIHNLTNMKLKLSSVTTRNNKPWQGHSRPNENLDGKVIEPFKSLTQEEDLNSYESKAEFDVAYSLTADDGTTYTFTSWYDQYHARKENHYCANYHKDNTGTKKFVVCQTGGAIRDTDGADRRDTLSLYIFEECGHELKSGGFVNSDSGELLTTLAVAGDLHYENDQNNANNKNAKKLQEYIWSRKSGGTPLYDACFLMGDLVDRPMENRLKYYTDDWKVGSQKPCLFDGYGNHDMFYCTGYSVDIAKEIAKRNDIRKGFLGNDFVIDLKYSDNLHYKWSQNFDGTRVHFFMLNQVPKFGIVQGSKGSGDKNGRDVDREKNSSRSLDFFCNQLTDIPLNEPIFIFVHCSFWYTADAESEWINDEEIRIFTSLLKHHNVCGIFSGHHHTFHSDTISLLETGSSKELKNIPAICSGMVKKAGYVEVEIRKTDMDVDICVREKYA